jgi:segregation and condensation protein A
MNSAIPNALAPNSHIRVLDEWHETMPEDLYIPPAAFEILLEHFEGPLDFLIYLIQKNGFDLLQLDLAPLATQYLSYMQHMKALNIELTADYMVMAALLAELKSRLLLPKPTKVQLEADPQHLLIERLEQYLRIKQAAERLAQMPVLERDVFAAQVQMPYTEVAVLEASAEQLRDAMLCIFQRPQLMVHEVKAEPVHLEERMQAIESALRQGQVLSFAQLLKPSQGRMGVVVSFMAILELTRQQKLSLVSTGIDAMLSVQGRLR